MTKKIVTLLALFLLITGCDKNDESFNKDEKNYKSKIQILANTPTKNSTKNSKENPVAAKIIAEFDVAVADKKDTMERGLMNVDFLAERHGMLFLFSHSRIINMWMKDTKIALDMIFIDENDRIVTIKTNAQPYSSNIISSYKMANKVLEINAKEVAKHHIQIGQKINFIRN